MNPRLDPGNLGTMVCTHSRYDLGDVQLRDKSLRDYMADLAAELDPTVPDRIEYWENGAGWKRCVREAGQDFRRASEIADARIHKLIATALSGLVILDLYLYDHSGLVMNTTGFSCGWDSGNVGVIYATHEQIKKEFNVNRISKNIRRKTAEILQAEVKAYSDYLSRE